VTVASIVGLLLPATDEGSTAEVVVGFVVGVAFLTIARLTLRGRDVHVGKMSGAGGSVVSTRLLRALRPQPAGGFRNRHVLTSAPQPLGAAIAFPLVESVSSLLAVSFAFAAGAMLALVVSDLLPRSLSPLGWRGPVGLMAGALVMLALSAALGV